MCNVVGIVTDVYINKLAEFNFLLNLLIDERYLHPMYMQIYLPDVQLGGSTVRVDQPVAQTVRVSWLGNLWPVLQCATVAVSVPVD